MESIASGMIIEDLNLNHCSGISDVGLSIFITETPSLIRLQLRWAKQVSYQYQLLQLAIVSDIQSLSVVLSLAHSSREVNVICLTRSFISFPPVFFN